MDKRFAIVCCHVVKESVPPAFLFRTQPSTEADSGWQCLCGKEHSMSDAMIVSMDDVLQLCPQLEVIKEEPYPCAFSFDPMSKAFKREQMG